MFVANLLVQLVGKDGSVLAVEVGFKGMSYGFVQQNTRTTGSHHYRQFTAFGLNGLEHNCRIIHHLTCQNFNNIIRQKFETLSIRTGSIIIFHTPILFHHAESHIGHHRAVIIVSDAFGIAEQHMGSAITQTGLHFAHAFIQ